MLLCDFSGRGYPYIPLSPAHLKVQACCLQQQANQMFVIHLYYINDASTDELH